MASKGKKRFHVPQGPVNQQLEQMQNQMAGAQAALAERIVTGSAGGGAVTVEMTGTQELRGVKIKPEVVDPEDVEMLQDLIMAAYGDALAKSRQLMLESFGPLAGGMDLSGLL